MTTLDATAIKAAHDAALPVIERGAAPFHVIDVAVAAYLDALSSLPARAVDDRRQKYADRIAKIHGRDLDLCFGMGEFAADVTDEQKRAAMMAFFFPNTSSAPSQPAAVGEDKPLTIVYTNWRGETAERRILPTGIWFGSTDRHPAPQWLVKAIDVEKGAERDFAWNGIDFQGDGPAAVAVTDEMVERVSVPYDGFTGDVIGSYTTREGKHGVVVQQDGTRVVHVYGRSRLEAALRSTQ